MHQHHEAFIAAIDERELVVVTFASKENGADILVRTCAPLDFGPSSQAGDRSPRYHLHDYDSDEGPHALSLLPEQVVSIAPTGEDFDPGEFITWDPAWHHPRDWGAYG